MKIAFVNSTHKWGGVKTWCLDNGAALQRLGHEVHIYGRPGPFVDKAGELDIPATPVEFGPDLSPGTVLFFFREFRRHGFDVVVLNVSKDLRTAGIAARLAGIRMVQHIGAPADVKNRFKTRLTQRLLGPKLVACSEFVRFHQSERVPLYKAYDFVAIHPGVMPSPSAPCRVGTPRTIVATSQLNPDKGHADLLHALADLHGDGVDFKCIIAGAGSIETKLKELCSELGLDTRVEWTGFTKDIGAVLDRGDIFVLPTYSEPLGIALEEALAHGLVPIARNAGGVPEIWPNYLPDLLVNPEPGPVHLREALRRAIHASNADLLAWKEKTHSHAQATFHVDTQAGKLLEWMVR